MERIKFILCSSTESFNSNYASGNILKTDLVFIEETKQIWTNGVFYATKNFSSDVISKLNSIADIIITNGDGSKVLTNNGTYVDRSRLGNTTIGSETKHVYFKEGLAQASSSTIGSLYKPIYLYKGDIAPCSDTLDININGNVVRNIGCNKVSTLTLLPVDKSLIVASLSDATNITLSSDMNVGESITIIATSSKDFTQPLPSTGNWVSMDGDTLDIKANKKFEINIYCYDEEDERLLYSISCKNMK